MVKQLVLSLIAAALMATPVMTEAQTPPQSSAQFGNPIIIAHRGASGDRPEHTLEAYQLGIEQGADYIEPDLVFTKDGVLVARHENEISETTNVAERTEFASRKTTKTIDGKEYTGWFTEDFTLAELKTLKAKERLPRIRPQNTAYDGQFDIPTFAEVIALVREAEKENGRRIGLYPELKHPGYFGALGFRPVDSLLAVLRSAGYTGDDPVLVQSFEATPLVQLKFRSDFKGIQLISDKGGPADAPQLTYAQFLQPEGLKQVATYAHGIGVKINLVLKEDGTPTDLVANAKAAGLKVHAWTMRKENAFMPERHRSSDVRLTKNGCIALFWYELEKAGVDGVFTDDPKWARTARDAGSDSIVNCHRYIDPPKKPEGG